MISYKWNLSPEQSSNKEALYKLQACLVAAGVYLDLSWNEDVPQLSISVPEELLEKIAAQQNGQDSSKISQEGNEAAQDPPKRRGRPSVIPGNDITLGRVYHMRFMGTSAEAIAKEIGVSKRTFYRRFAKASGKNLDPDTPFSQWDS